MPTSNPNHNSLSPAIVATGDSVSKERPPHYDALSDLLEKEGTRLQTLIKQQWRMVALAIGLAFAVIVGIACLAFANMERQPRELVERIRVSQQALTKALSSQPTVPGYMIFPAQNQNQAVNDAVLKLVKAQDESLGKLAELEAKPSASAQSIVQLVGSAAVVTLLGLLGLQRLQNFDSEISSLRNSVDTRVEARARELKLDAVETMKAVAQIQAKLDGDLSILETKLRSELQDRVKIDIASELKANEDAVTGLGEKIRHQGEELSSQFEGQFKRTEQQINESLMKAVSISDEIGNLIERYPWLGQKGASEVIEKINDLASVDEAHELSTNLSASGDRKSARAALRAIVDRKLSGSFDAFHNACAQAQRMDDPRLVLEIAEQGLIAFSNQVDLIADKMQALNNLGRAAEAQAFFNEWRASNPAEAGKGWRAIMFYGSLLRALSLNEHEMTEASQVLEAASNSMPLEPKVWGARLEFEMRNNRYEVAEQVASEAVSHNPFSQQLHMQHGEILLTLGRAQEAKDALMKALKVDFQDQYQHDVNQAAVVASLGQACEAYAEPEEAVSYYAHIVVGSVGSEGSRFISTYAENRLKALALLEVPGAKEALEKKSNASDASMRNLASLFGQMRMGGPKTVDEEGE